MPNNRKPIIVSNPKDPRLQAYRDSLSLYNKTQDIGNPKYYKTNSKPSWYNWKGNREDIEKFMRKNNIDLDFNYYRTGKFPGKIQPIKTGDFGEGMAWPVYKKPEQPYIYKKPIVDTRDKTIIKPLTIKTPSLNINTDIPERTPRPIVAPKKLPGGSGKFARYPNMKNQLGSLKTSRMVNAKKVENIVPTFLSGAKSVKQYRGDENLPEAKKGMKNCGCKHSKKKYKYGTGALTIPEGSAIVTANGGKNKQALRAYKKGNYKLLNNIIEDMPEDNPNGKNQVGNDAVGVMRNSLSVSQALEQNVKPGFYPDTVQAPAPGYTTKRTPSKQKQMELEYEKDPKSFEKKYGKTATSLQKERMQAVANKQETFKWSNNNKEYKSGFIIDKKEPAKSSIPMRTSTNNTTDIKSPEGKKDDDKKDEKSKGRGIGNFLSNIPSLAEIAAKGSILKQGVEDVPENYLKLDRYNYASQLPKTLQEISLAEQAGRESARDVVAGDAGRYLAQAGNLSAARMKAANDAVIQDTLARQDILNKNIDLGNVEAQTNTALKNQFAMQRAANRGAYNNMLVSLGQSIDTAADTSKLMAAQKQADEQRIQVLKDAAKSGNYKWKQDGSTLTLEPKKKGAKRLKTYKRK